MEEKDKIEEIGHKKSHKNLGRTIGIGIAVYVLGIAFGLCLHSCVSFGAKAEDHNAAQIITTPLYASAYGEIDFNYVTPRTYMSLYNSHFEDFIAYYSELDLNGVILQDSRIMISSYSVKLYDNNEDLIVNIPLLEESQQNVILDNNSYLTCGCYVVNVRDYVTFQSRLSGYPSEYFVNDIDDYEFAEYIEIDYIDRVFYFDSDEPKPLLTMRYDNILELINEQVQYGYQYENGRREVQDNPGDYGLYTGGEYEQNYQNGYQAGYLAGEQQATDFSFGTLLASVFSAPITMFQNAFNFEFFGINMSALIGFLLSIGLVIFIISVFKKN